MEDAGLAYLLLLVARFGLADTGKGFLDAGDNLDVAFLVDLEAIDLAGVEVAFDMPEMAAAATGKDDIGGKFFIAEAVVPDSVEPDDVVATVVGKSHILAAVHTHVLVDDGAHPFLVVVVAVNIGDALLNQRLGIGDFGIGRGETAILAFDGEVDLHLLMERPSVVVVPPDLGGFPFFHRLNVFLGAHGGAKKRDNKPQNQFLHYLFLVSFQLQKYSYFSIHANFFFHIAKNVVYLHFEFNNAIISKIVYIMNKFVTVKEAADKIQDGMTVMVGGFLGVGNPIALIDELVARNVKNLTIICNDTAYPEVGVGKLITNHQVKELIATHIGTNNNTIDQMNAGELKVTLQPQGTLAEQIRAAGAGLGGVLTQTGLGTVVENGKQKVTVDGKEYLLEKPVRADVAIIGANIADEEGNLVYKGTSQNFCPMMATAADTVIVEPQEIVATGTIAPENVKTPGIFVDYIIKK